MSRPAGALPYSAEEDEALAALWAEGLSANAIAARLGRTGGSVQNRIGRLNLPARPRGTRWSAEEDAMLRGMARQGRNAREVSERLAGRNRDMVISRAKKLKIVWRRGRSRGQAARPRPRGPAPDNRPATNAEEAAHRRACAAANTRFAKAMIAAGHLPTCAIAGVWEPEGACA